MQLRYCKIKPNITLHNMNFPENLPNGKIFSFNPEFMTHLQK